MDQVKSNFFENQILEAIETVANGIVSKIKFDQTILCTITNDEKRKKGIYEVTDGTSTFEACSNDDSYREDMIVYVLIPQGDYENQKTIIGKYVDDTSSAINYISMMDSFISVNGSSNIQEYSLIANHPDRRFINIPIDVDYLKETNQYNCVGIQADFKTDLSQEHIIAGNYGLILTLYGEDVSTKQPIPPKSYALDCSEMYGDPYNYNFYFTQSMVFDLAKDFADTKITNATISFYQNKNFKTLDNEELSYTYSTTHTYIDENGTGQKEEIISREKQPNLFVKNVVLKFGYNLSDITEESIRLYSLNDTKYISRSDKKNISLKWFVKNEVEEKLPYLIIDNKEEAGNETYKDLTGDYSIYWYRYKIDNSEKDPLAGVYWNIIPERIYNDKIFIKNGESEKNELMYALEENPKGKYAKVNDDAENGALILATPDNKIKYDVVEILSGKRYSSDTVLDKQEEPFEYTFGPNELLNREKIKAILVRNEWREVLTEGKDDDNIYVHFEDASKYYESNELVYENANPASQNLASVDLIRNMRLECQDGSNGIYKLYNGVDNVIIGNEDTRDRILNVIFDTYSTIDIPLDEEKCSIKWKIPKNNSMIHTVNFSINNTDKISIQDDYIEWQTEGNYYTCSYNWISNIAGTDNHYEGVSLPVHYCIHDYYTQSYSNNTIICEITKYNRVYTAEIEFIFGETGTNGTGYTLNLRLEKEYDLNGNSLTETPVPCLTYGGNKVKVIASLFDEHGKDISVGKIFKWNWLNNVSGFNCDVAGKDTATVNCYIQHDGKTSIAKCYGILSATVAGDWFGKNVQLTGYLPLGIRSPSSEMTTYEGTTKIIYNEQGMKPTYQKEHSLDTATTKWEVKVLEDNNDEWKNYSPQFKIRQIEDIGPWILIARDMYFSELATKQIVIHAYKDKDIIYSQSLLYDQNRFGNAMFNNWDGSLVVDKDGNKILSALIGAGKKETDNTFTGVVMGKTTTNSGLIGYSKGVQTFGFDTDGTAFIGASGKGRIEFNGTTGTIQSGNYKQTKEGIKIDLDDGKFELNPTKILKTDLGGQKEIDFINSLQSAYIQINTNKEPYFEIKTISSINKDENGEYIYETIDDTQYLTYKYTPLISIGKNEYYLQSKNFSDTDKTGVKLDLKKGKLTGYDFLITATGTKGMLTINSADSTYPLEIGTNFKVGWDGKIEATEGKFSGTLTAATGTFTGTITAESGAIGGWTIVPNALYYGDSEKHIFNTKNNELTSFNTGINRAFFAPKGVATTDFKYSTTTYTVTTDATTGKYSITQTDKYDNTLTSSVKILFNVGQNFAITTDGTIYANALYLKDYAKTTDLKTLSDKAFAGINTNISSIGSINNEINDMNTQYGSIIKVSGNNKTNTYMTKGGSYDGVTSGYFFEGNFYSDAEHKTLMNKKNNYVYVDISTGDTYSCKNSTYTKNNDIKFFTVSTKGLLTANNAVISGTIYATNGWFSGGISASEGHFGNWKILKTGQLKGTPSDKKAGYEIILNPNYEASEATRTFYYTYTQEVKNSSPDTVEDDTDITGSTINSTKISFEIEASDDFDDMKTKFVNAIHHQANDWSFEWEDLPILQRIILMTQFIFFKSTLIDSNIFKIKNTDNSMIFGIDGNGFLNWRFYKNNSFRSEESRFIIQTDGNGLNIGWVDLNDMTRATWSFTSDGNLRLSKLKSTSYKDNIGGFQLYGEDASDKFWNNSFFTTNTIKTGTNTYSHYVTFLRAVGSTSNSLVNAFIGCKQYDSRYESWPSNNIWSNNAHYNFYIRFDGRVKFETFHTYKWEDSEGGKKITKYTIRPNEPSKASDGTLRTCKYYLGTYAYPWTGLHVESINGETVSRGTLKNTDSDIRLKSIQSNDILEKALKVYNCLTPIAYKYKNLQKTDHYKRTHIGFIAQDVEQQIFNQGLTNEDFAIVKIYQAEGKEIIPGCEDGKKYQLDYNELHGLHVLKNQEQDKRILELEQKVQYLENKILELSEKGV